MIVCIFLEAPGGAEVLSGSGLLGMIGGMGKRWMGYVCGRV